jgi:hypothetical protein
LCFSGTQHLPHDDDDQSTERSIWIVLATLASTTNLYKIISII